MTSDDLVRRLQAAKRCIYHPRSQAVEDEAERAIDDAIDALTAPPAANLREWVRHKDDCECVRSRTVYGVTLGEGGHCTCGLREALAAALAAPPAAPSADLVAIVRHLQEADAVLKQVASARAMRRWHEALNKVVAYALERTPAAPRVPDTPVLRNYAQDLRDAGLLLAPLHAARVPDTPQGRCARWPACKWDSEGGKIHTCSICGPECSC